MERAWRGAGDDARTAPYPAVFRYLFVASFLLYLLLGARMVSVQSPTGDEPWYLAMADSLWHDHTLDLRRELESRRYQSFYPAGELDPGGQAFDYRDDGRLRSIHSVGLSVLILPFFAAAGRLGVGAFLALLAACTSFLMLRIAYRASGGHMWPALLAWLCLSFTVPLALFSMQVYPAVPAALVMAYAWARLQPAVADRRQRWTMPWALLLGAAALPWLHTRYIPVSLAIVGLAIYLAQRDGAMRRRLWLQALPLCVSLAALLLYNRYLYGHWSPGQAYPQLAAPRGLLSWRWREAGAFIGGLFLDRQSGLLIFSPVFLLVAPGTVALWRRGRSEALLFLLLCSGALVAFAGNLLANVAYQGTSLPARFLVEVVPLCAAPIAALFARGRARTPWFALTSLLLLWSWLAAGGLLLNPDLLYPSEPGENRLFNRYLGAAPNPSHLLPVLLCRGDVDRTYGADSLALRHGTGQPGPATRDGRPGWVGVPGRDSAGVLVAGPSTALPRGSYTATFSLRLLPRDVAAEAAAVQVAAVYRGREEVLAQRSLSGGESSGGGEKRVTLSFRADGYRPLEYRVIFTGAALVEFYGVEQRRAARDHGGRAVVEDVPAVQKSLPGDAVPLGAALGDGIRLDAYQVAGDAVRAGSTLDLTLFWRSPGGLQRNYTVFTHLVDAAGKVWGQHDGQPAHTSRPTTSWLPDEVITDRHALRLQPETPPGEYALEAGLYVLESGRRLAAPDGTDRILLPVRVQVVEGDQT